MAKQPIWETPSQATDAARAKDELCYTLQRVQARNQWTQRQMAAFLGTSISSVSKATRIPTARKMSYNRLFRYLSRAESRFRLLISI